MNTKRIGIIMNGVTGRMGTNQHLLRSICAIRDQGGLLGPNGLHLIPEPMLVGRNPDKLSDLANRAHVNTWTTDLDAALENNDFEIYFDAQTTDRRPAAVQKALAAGKHVYCEKPAALTAHDALALHQLAQQKKLKTGVVQDKLWLPGFQKLDNLLQAGLLGRVLSVRGEFGYWVFEGDRRQSQRPSWNYRKEDGGGIILDMLCHFSYLLESLFGPVQTVSCLGATHIPQRVDEQGQAYQCTADDAAYVTLQLTDGVIAHFNASWCTRVRRDDLLTLQVDGTEGSALATLRRCWQQSYDQTPHAVWNPDMENPADFLGDWHEIADETDHENAFKTQWELFLRHVAFDEPYRWTLREGAVNILLAEKAMESWQQRRWVDIPQL